tara:strand:- start:53 stop:499 length:447 start_codon:yes stop_codon:yes gene_type:complete
MGIFATIGGSIVFHDFDDVKCAFEKLKTSGEVTEDGMWILDKAEGSDLKAYSESLLTIDIPLFCYKNLYASLRDLIVKSPTHLIVWTSSDGIFEGGVFEDGSYVNYCLKNWGAKKGIYLPDEQDPDIGKRSEMMKKIEALFFEEFLMD